MTEPCPRCGAKIGEEELSANLWVCPECSNHFRMGARERIAYVADPGSFKEFGAGLTSLNPIEMAGYEQKLSAASDDTNLSEAVITGTCAIEGRPCVLAVMSFQFLGGSMGSVVGEKVTRAVLTGAASGLPVVIFTASGGARMQEGIFSLMQMAKTASAVAELDAARLPLFIVLCDPTTAGVVASFAMLGDVTLAEPDALIGFAGPRVIQGTIKQKLPEGFQRAEFQLEKGFVDLIAARSEQRRLLAYLIDTHRPREKEKAHGRG
jgi:acetyl-CoA carboxylase carboxyl transferase subunit beta